MAIEIKNNLVVTLADKKYIDQAKQLFSSIYFNSGWKGDYMLLAHEIPEEELIWFKERGILVKRCESLITETRGKWPASVYSKFYLFTEDFKEWENIIFLDADIIVKSSLDNLTKIDGFGAVQSHKKFSKLLLLPIEVKIEAKGVKEYNQLKKETYLNSACFSSGVFTFNSKIIKDNHFSELVGLTQKYAKLSASGEELILNMVFNKQWSKLPYCYNTNPDYLSYFFGIKPSKINAVILHFSFLSKPWDPGHSYYSEWKSNLDKSNRIDLKNRPAPISTLNDVELVRQERFIKNRMFVLPFKLKYWEAKSILYRQVGLRLKTHFPRFYKFLKLWF